MPNTTWWRWSSSSTVSGAVGFNWTDDYSDQLWLIAGESVYEVREGFPRITPTMFPSGVGNVGYAIALADCEPFLVDVATLRIAASEARRCLLTSSHANSFRMS